MVARIGGKLQTKRVVLFLLEGQNDEEALIPPFKMLLNERASVFSEVFHCDVTVAHLFKGSCGITIKSDVCETVRMFILEHLERGQGYTWGDLAAVVHIVDTDGAFAPEDCIIEDQSSKIIRYSQEGIICSDKPWIVKRNAEKSASLNKLVRKRTLSWRGKKVPYTVYYLSRNFEHALLGVERSLSNEEKDQLAQLFRRKYVNNPDAFLELLKQSANGAPSGYGESWAYIQEGMRSLEGHTNLFLALEDVLDSLGIEGAAVE